MIEISGTASNRGNRMRRRVPAQRVQIDGMVRASIAARRRKRLAAKFSGTTHIHVMVKPVGLFSAPIKTVDAATRALIDNAMQRQEKHGEAPTE